MRHVDFKERHVFIAKLRILILVSFWGLVIFFYPDLLWADQPVMLLFSLTFAVTTISYYLILNGHVPYIVFIIELIADVAAQTLVMHITGGPSSPFYIVYIVYCIAGGLFFTWQVSVVNAILALIFFSGLIFAYQTGAVMPLDYPIESFAWFNDPSFEGGSNLILLAIFFLVTIYGLSIASYFTKQRERALEESNRELMSLNRVSSTIRSVITLERVVDAILRNLTGSYGFQGAFLLLVDEEEEKLRLISQKGAMSQRISDSLGFFVDDIYLPLSDENNPVYQSMKKQKRYLRNDLAELTVGSIPGVSSAKAKRLREEFEFRKIIAVPMIAERRLVGGLVALSSKEWLSDNEIAAFERYADQAALALDNAALIETLRRKNIELERVSRVKSEFLATMSHELRTPLTAIIGFSELLLEEVLGELKEEQKESMLEVLNNAENLLQLINSLLDFAKIEAGRMGMNVENIDVIETIKRVERTVQPLIKKKGHQLVIDAPEELPLLEADQRKVQQIMLNLVSNAIKFTDEGGTITLAAHYCKNISDLENWDNADISALTDGVFELSVSDNGIGIGRENLDVIFESFRQVDSSFTRNYQGTGLGLALCQQFVDMHHGRIKAESHTSRGSTFRVILPAHYRTI
jgi:signal transduction histidine kinase